MTTTKYNDQAYDRQTKTDKGNDNNKISRRGKGTFLSLFLTGIFLSLFLTGIFLSFYLSYRYISLYLSYRFMSFFLSSQSIFLSTFLTGIFLSFYLSYELFLSTFLTGIFLSFYLSYRYISLYLSYRYISFFLPFIPHHQSYLMRQIPEGSGYRQHPVETAVVYETAGMLNPPLFVRKTGLVVSRGPDGFLPHR